MDFFQKQPKPAPNKASHSTKPTPEEHKPLPTQAQQLSVNTLVRERGNLYFLQSGNFVGYDNLRKESNILIVTNWDKIKNNYRVKGWEINHAIVKPYTKTLSNYIDFNSQNKTIHHKLLKSIVYDLTSEHIGLLEDKETSGPALAGENENKIYITHQKGKINAVWDSYFQLVNLIYHEQRHKNNPLIFFIHHVNVYKQQISHTTFPLTSDYFKDYIIRAMSVRLMNAFVSPKQPAANIKNEITEINKSLGGTNFQLKFVINEKEKHLSHIKVHKNSKEQPPIIYYNPDLDPID